MKKSQVIAQLQELLEQNMKELIESKNELEICNVNYEIYRDTADRLKIELNKYKNMSVIQFIKSKYAK